MKTLLFLIGLGIFTLQVEAQQPPVKHQEKTVTEKKSDNGQSSSVKKETTSKSENGSTVKTETKTESRSGSKSKAGEATSDVAHGVKKGTSYTWDKTKHNKATKHTFNQPGS